MNAAAQGLLLLLPPLAPQNCADVAAEWFTELGCSVAWAPMRTGLAAAQ